MTRTELKDLITSTLQDDSPNSALEMRTLLNLLVDGISNTVEMREVATSYITANFDPTGLGINLELGYAICNGNNGTRDWRGRVPMQYSTTYPTLGATGGSADAVVVSHTHTVDGTAGTDGGTGTQRFATGTQNETGGGFGISTVGESGVGKNMQPYIVTLIVMKL